MAARKQASINLLPQEDFAASTTGRILHWLLSTFRYLVITTEMIVIVAFLSRFYFDSRTADLNDELTQKQEFIEAYSQFEADFRATQTRLSVFSELTQESNQVSPLIERVTSRMPGTLFLTNLSIAPHNTIAIQGSSLNEQDISQFVANLRAEKSFTNVSLTKIESISGSNVVEFTITITLTT